MKDEELSVANREEPVRETATFHASKVLLPALVDSKPALPVRIDRRKWPQISSRTATLWWITSRGFLRLSQIFGYYLWSATKVAVFAILTALLISLLTVDHLDFDL